MTKSTICGIWGFHDGDVSSRGLLGCDAVWCCSRTPGSHRSQCRRNRLEKPTIMR